MTDTTDTRDRLLAMAEATETALSGRLDRRPLWFLHDNETNMAKWHKRNDDLVATSRLLRVLANPTARESVENKAMDSYHDANPYQNSVSRVALRSFLSTFLKEAMVND